MLEHEEPFTSTFNKNKTPWQKYRTRKRLGLEGPASPGSVLIIDMLQSCKPLGSTEDVHGVKPEEQQVQEVCLGAKKIPQV